MQFVYLVFQSEDGIIVEQTADGQVFYCSYCQKSYTARRSAQRHIASVHLNYKVYCPICGSGYTRKFSLRDHMARMHDVKV